MILDPEDEMDTGIKKGCVDDAAAKAALGDDESLMPNIKGRMLCQKTGVEGTLSMRFVCYCNQTDCNQPYDYKTFIKG